MVYILALAGLIVAGVITTTIINVIKNNQNEVDIRAKAGTLNTLKFMGVVSQINDIDGTIMVNDVQLTQESRSGNAVNYGIWTVTPPTSFSLFSAQPGTKISFTVSTNTFNVASREVAAVTVTISK